VNQSMLLAAVIFIAAYIFIISEKIHRTTAALLGAAALVVFKFLSLEEAWTKYLDFNTLGLLTGMMIIVVITRRTGVFQYLALKVAKLAKGNPWHILVALSLVTALCSALLDNVTTVLLIAPITILIADTLGKNPLPFLIAEILAANIGGTATLVGDPPNILISSAAHLSFLDFIINLTPICIIILFVTLFIIRFVFRKHLRPSPQLREKVLAFDETKAIRDRQLLKKSLFVLALTVSGFMVHHLLGLPPSAIALTGAVILLAISKISPDEVLKEIQWPVLFFFGGLFILVGGIEKAGLLNLAAERITNLTQDPILLAFIIIWISAIASSFLDNIPFVATMIPLIKAMGVNLHLSPEHLIPLWWALALGACLGGNGTLVGASANVIVAGISEKTRTPLSFKMYLKIGMPLMLLSVLMATVYLYLRYLR